MKEHKRLEDKQPEDGQMCEVSLECREGVIRQLGEKEWMARGQYFDDKKLGAFFSDPERIWWRVKG